MATKETVMNGSLAKWALGILGTLAASGIIGNVAMYGQVSRNTVTIKNIDKRLDRMELVQHEILMELRK